MMAELKLSKQELANGVLPDELLEKVSGGYGQEENYWGTLYCEKAPDDQTFKHRAHGGWCPDYAEKHEFHRVGCTNCWHLGAR